MHDTDSGAGPEFLKVSGLGLEEAGNFVLKDISFTQREFQNIALAGETGSGKSTLLQTIAGLVQPSAGEVRFDHKRVKGPQEHLIPGHPGIAYLSQQFELPRFLRVEQVMAYASKLEPTYASALFELCRIDHLLKRRTDHLSGGERQRIALARLLLSAPRLLLLDEPFSNLNIVHKKILKTILRELSETLAITCMLVSHDPLDTLAWADEILVIQGGQIMQRGTPEQVYYQPANEYTAGLFGDYNLLPAETAGVLGLEFTGKNLLIRPESFKILTGEKPGLQGVVIKSIFYGSYQELEISVSGTVITVKTGVNPMAEGSIVHLALQQEQVWYI